MRAVDTNVLLRFVTADDAAQAARVQRLFEECKGSREILFISTPVLCELVWVLRSGFRQPKNEILKVLENVASDALFQIQHHALVASALEQYREGSADFADYLIGGLAQHAGCRDTVTFDQGLRGSSGFTLL
jgi:predicted nucleic-acid-binding protein